MAEDSGLIVALGEWVLRKACAQGAAWRAASWDVGVSVNIALRQLNAPHFPAQVAAALAETGLPPSALTIELSERMLVEDAGLIADRLAELRDLGVKLAIDDFGTGYASLAHLRAAARGHHQDRPVLHLRARPGPGADACSPRRSCRSGRDLGMQVVAEGIEQPRQLAELREMGCGYGQGFLVARPMAAPGVEALHPDREPVEFGNAAAPDVSGTAKPGVPAA